MVAAARAALREAERTAAPPDRDRSPAAATSQMRVLFISRRFFPAISGMSVYAASLLRELTRAGHDVTMISQFRGDPAGRAVYGGGPPPPVPGVRVIGLEARGEQAGGDFERDIDEMVSVACKEHRARGSFDVVHAQYGYPTGLAGVEAARRFGVPSVVSIQGGDGHWVGSCCELHLAAMRVVCEHSGELLIGSSSFRDEVVRRLGVPPERFTLVPGAVDPIRFAPSAEGRDAELLVYHGRVDRRKGVLDLLAAVRQVPGARLVVSGVGPDLEAVRARASERVRVLGYVGYDDAPAVLARGGIFVSPTYAEGFSNTILEAMAAGMAIISCRSVGVVDCLRHEENALLVDPGDVDALAGAIARLLAEPELRERLARAALAEVRRKYSWSRVAGLIEDAYRRALETPANGSWSLPADRPPCRFRAEPHLL
jgi:glycogen synthase